MTSKLCSMTGLLISLSMALSNGCSHNAKPVVVTVRESCIRTNPPSEEMLIDCLDLGKTREDCAAQEIEALRKWIAVQLARCGVRP